MRRLLNGARKSPNLPTRVSDFKVYVLGCSVGESIVIEFDGRYGVIDSFRHDGGVPPLRFLQRRGVRELAFLGLTHPHEDHYGGMAEILGYFLKLEGVKEFWRSPALDWSKTYQVLKLRVAKMVQAPTFHAAAAASLQDLADLYELLFQNRDRLIVRNFEVGLARSLGPGLSCVGIAPPGNFVLRAQERLAWELTQNDHKSEPLNDYSFGLHLKLGDSSVFLTGDAGRNSWPACRADPVWIESVKPGAQVLLKAPHHGSVKDSPDWLLAFLAGSAETTTVVTRYNRSRLPRVAGLTRLGGLGNAYRLSEQSGPNGKGLVPEYLEVEVKPDGIQCRRHVL